MTPIQNLIRLDVKEIATGKTVHSVGPMPRWKVEKVLRGMLIKMDTDRFFVDEREVKVKPYCAECLKNMKEKELK